MTGTADGYGRGSPAASDGTRRALMALVTAATVRIHGPAAGYVPERLDGFLGSGFFIAPSWVLTCAHVAMQGGGREVDVVYEAQPGAGETSVKGTVVAALPDNAPAAVAASWPAPDLALVKLGRPVDHPCVYVTERPTAFFGGEEVRFAGWTAVDGRLQRLSGRLQVQGTVGEWSDEQIRLGGDTVPPGASGGPTVDMARGEVIGVVKSRSRDGLGGTSIGIEQLRSLPVPPAMATAESDDDYQAVFHAHDRYHADHHANSSGTKQTWADVQSRLGAGAGRVLSPQQRTVLLGRLAELPPPVSTPGLLDLLARLPDMYPVEGYALPRAWRDGLGALYEARDGQSAVELILRYCMSAIVAERPYVAPGTGEAEKDLWEWVKSVADDRLPRQFRNDLSFQWGTSRHRTDREQRRAAPAYGERPREGERSHVLLVLEPRSWEPDSFDWRLGVARFNGEVRPVAMDSGGTAFHALQERLAAPLAEAFRRCDEPDSPAMLQVALAQSMLGLDVDNWRMGPGEPPLGSLRPVVVRCSDLPVPTEAEADETKARWQRTWSGAMRAHVVDCADELWVSVPSEDELRALAYDTVPVLCRHAVRPDAEGAAALARVVRGGFRIALLRRRGPQPPDVVCGEFHRRVFDTVGEAGTADQLPRRIHELRQGVRAERPETYWSDGLALLYDDPRHPLPGTGQLLEAP
ncbi:hypothetical protein QR77_27885 [Streptomyces sp. 150FB]|nr:hypothetical protein QR77_27885 [Streptomyces sp. 150FB]